MKMHELPPAFVQQVLVCPSCGNHLLFPSGPEADLAREGHMLVLHCANCHEVCQGRFFVPQPDIHEVARLRAAVKT